MRNGDETAKREAALSAGIEKAGLTGVINPYEVRFNTWNGISTPKTQTILKRTAIRTAPTAIDTRPTKTTTSLCPAGESYAKVKMGGLFNRRTIFEGCVTPSEIAHWRNQAHQDSQRRWNNFGRAIQKAGDDFNRQVQQDIRDQQNRQRNCTTNFVGSTAYTNCY